MVILSCMVSIGQVSNPEHKNQSFSKAGRMRWKDIRPIVQGVAMNPVDHPNGGGEGKNTGGRPSVSKWGKPTKGHRTRNKRKLSGKYIVKRRFEK
ncbi:50S ribosomal protein L2 [Gracilariopsis chorda]|uniref:50S ribosomal protein L2 n=1 Tax=Gracilariopsis chorda TaxID=448386 RepID=A0A2V3IM00_9FLOR|nr:50S ribosomal protein L2 [Gracilariopsis chorda]|eukprot:PXF43083.1 50S ribosomal protein L2 [Gracilariopsis chorda]